MIIYNELRQKTLEWYALRQLKQTASNAYKIIAGGNILFNYCVELVNEFLYGVKDRVINEHIQRGVELEPVARELAETLYNCKYTEVGAVVQNDRVLVSPDGCIFDDDGNIIELIEIKCPSDKTFNKVLGGYIDKKYMAQMQMQMLICECKKCRYFVYNENIEPFYYSVMVEADAVMQEKLKENLAEGANIIDILLLDYFEKLGA